MRDDHIDATRISVGMISAAKLAAGVIGKKQSIVESGIAYTEADAVIFRLRGFEQSQTDPMVWNLWSK